MIRLKEIKKTILKHVKLRRKKEPATKTEETHGGEISKVTLILEDGSKFQRHLVWNFAKKQKPKKW